MNQERIGKFIAEQRKLKGLTQEQIAEKLYVTKNAVSKWERGLCLMDMSLLKPLSEILGVSINEILAGQKIDNKDIEKKSEENIVNTIDYSTKKIDKYNKISSLILIVLGLCISVCAIMIFPSESSWGSNYSVFGVVIFMIGILKLLNKVIWYIRLSLITLIFIFVMGFLIFTDYLNVIINNVAPMFRITTTTTGDVIYYDTLFYDVYRCNFDKEDEYWVIGKNSNPTTQDLLNYCK